MRPTGYRSSDLIAATREGAIIVTQDNTEVLYRPRKNNDQRPWLQKGKPGDSLRYRHAVGECRPVTPNGLGPWSVAKLLKF